MTLLRNIKIVEYAQGVPGPLAALRLANLGADVIKVEDEEGDWLRQVAPVIPESSMSAAFQELNRGKRALQVHPGKHDGLRTLLRHADVFITDRSNAELARMGLASFDDEASFDNTGLITISISPWGDKGPLRDMPGSELTTQAMAGYTRYLGRHNEASRRLGADVASASTGIFACQAVLAALLARVRGGGRGQRIAVSMLNSLISLKSIHLAAQSDPDRYAGPRVGGANYPPERGWKTRDEPIFFAFGGSVGAEGRPGWVKFIEEAGFTRLLNDPRFDKIGRTTTGYGSLVQEVRQEYEREFARYSAEELVEMIRKYAGNAAVYMRADEAINHPQTQALGIVREAPMSDGKPVKVRGFPARFSRLSPEALSHAPALGEHNTSIGAAIQAARWPSKDAI